MGIPDMPLARLPGPRSESEYGGQSNHALLGLMKALDQEIQQRRKGERPRWGITTQEAAEALISVFGGDDPFVMANTGPVPLHSLETTTRDIGGMTLVGYEEL